MSTSRYRVIDLRKAPGGGEGLTGFGLAADAGRGLARPGPAAPTAMLRDVALLILDVGRLRVAGRGLAGEAAVGHFGVLAGVPVIGRARAGWGGR